MRRLKCASSAASDAYFGSSTSRITRLYRQLLRSMPAHPSPKTGIPAHGVIIQQRKAAVFGKCKQRIGDQCASRPQAVDLVAILRAQSFQRGQIFQLARMELLFTQA